MELWIGFTALVLLLLAIDLIAFNRHAHKITIREAGIWSATLVSIALLFAVFLYFYMSPRHALEFLTGYVIEEALSVDNVFVFVLIFSYFRVPAEFQHRVLFWGVLGAMIGRGVMIFAGTILINRFEWIIYVFGAFLLYTGIRMGIGPDHSIEPDRNPALRFVRRFVRVTENYHGQHFFVKRGPPGARDVEQPEGSTGDATPATSNSTWWATPLFIVLITVETTDLIFAVDSIPAIFAVTRDPFIIYSSNVLAILGLRALYFVLADVIHRFHLLKYGLSIVLAFVGLKMLLSFYFHIPIGASLSIVAGVLAGSVIGSLLIPKN